jgi:hypothetical protein
MYEDIAENVDLLGSLLLLLLLILVFSLHHTRFFSYQASPSLCKAADPQRRYSCSHACPTVSVVLRRNKANAFVSE